MTKPEAIQIFLEISTQLRHEQLLKDGAGVVKAALRGDDGTVYYAELGGANAGDLSMQELEKRYNERFTSRIIGFYDRLIFRGKDIRMKKKLNPQNKQN